MALHRGDLARAESSYLKALKIAEAADNKPGLAQIFHQLGTPALLQGKLKSAEDWYRNALQIEEVFGDRVSIAGTYHQLGLVAQRLSDLVAAERWYRQALEITEALGERRLMAKNYGQLAVLAQERGDRSAMIKWMIRCVSLFSEFPHPATGPIPRGLARLAAKIGMPALEASWKQYIGTALPQTVRTKLTEMINSEKDSPVGRTSTALDANEKLGAN